MPNYDISPWVAAVAIVLGVWQAFHGPFSDEWWSAATQWVSLRLAGGKR